MYNIFSIVILVFLSSIGFAFNDGEAQKPIKKRKGYAENSFETEEDKKSFRKRQKTTHATSDFKEQKIATLEGNPQKVFNTASIIVQESQGKNLDQIDVELVNVVENAVKIFFENFDYYADRNYYLIAELTWLGEVYSTSNNEGQLSKAFFYFQQAAEFGGIKAMYNLARFFHKGIGVERDVHQAFFWYQQLSSLDAEKNYFDELLSIAKTKYKDNKEDSYAVFCMELAISKNIDITQIPKWLIVLPKIQRDENKNKFLENFEVFYKFLTHLAKKEQEEAALEKNGRSIFYLAVMLFKDFNEEESPFKKDPFKVFEIIELLKKDISREHSHIRGKKRKLLNEIIDYAEDLINGNDIEVKALIKAVEQKIEGSITKLTELIPNYNYQERDKLKPFLTSKEHLPIIHKLADIDHSEKRRLPAFNGFQIAANLGHPMAQFRFGQYIIEWVRDSRDESPNEQRQALNPLRMQVRYNNVPVPNNNMRNQNNNMPVRYNNGLVPHNNMRNQNNNMQVRYNNGPFLNNNMRNQNNNMPVRYNNGPVPHNNMRNQNNNMPVRYNNGPVPHNNMRNQNNNMPLRYNNGPFLNNNRRAQNNTSMMVLDENVDTNKLNLPKNLRELAEEQLIEIGIQNLEKAAKNNIPIAQAIIGEIYFDGGFIAPNIDKAISYLEMAENNNCNMNKHCLAQIYIENKEYTDNWYEYLEYLIDYADNTQKIEIIKFLAELFEQGVYVEQDIDRAAKYYDKIYSTNISEFYNQMKSKMNQNIMIINRDGNWNDYYIYSPFFEGLSESVNTYEDFLNAYPCASTNLEKFDEFMSYIQKEFVANGQGPFISKEGQRYLRKQLILGESQHYMDPIKRKMHLIMLGFRKDYDPENPNDVLRDFANSFLTSIRNCSTGKQDSLNRYYSQVFNSEKELSNVESLLINLVLKQMEYLFSSDGDLTPAILKQKFNDSELYQISHSSIFIRSIIGHHFGLEKFCFLEKAPREIRPKELCNLSKCELLLEALRVLPGLLIKGIKKDIDDILNDKERASLYTMPIAEFLGSYNEFIYNETLDGEDVYFITLEGAAMLLQKVGVLEQRSETL